MNSKIYISLIAVCFILLSTSCKKDDYLIGGSTHDPHVNMTTYDYLKTNPLFDTLVLLIDRAGMKEEINSNSTFFAPTDYSIKTLIEYRTEDIQIRYNDESLKYTVDSFPVQELKDSLRAYLFADQINRENLSLNDKVYKNMDGQDFSVKLIESNDYTGAVSTRPQYVYLVKIRSGLDPVDNSSIPDDEKDTREKIQTSGILTTNGVLHVIENYHVFFWVNRN
jgi:hypothetical protein